MDRAPLTWFVDPADPRAPPMAIWDRMTPEERARVVDSLAAKHGLINANPPEGDFRFNPRAAAKETLSAHFQRIGRRVYVACDLPICYPGESILTPDLVAVLDVDSEERAAWTVATERKGPDFALDIVWGGDPRKALEGNAVRCAALGITEYFVFDRRRGRVRGFRLLPGGHRYQPILPQLGCTASQVLGLELGLEGNRLRFFRGLAPLPEANERLTELGTIVNDLGIRLEAVEQQAEQERLRAERRLAEALAKIERLEGERG
jgi:Uma2 family endonuclease